MNDFARRLRRLVIQPAAPEVFTPDELAGQPELMMPAIYWPKRWLVEVLQGYAIQETAALRERVSDLEERDAAWREGREILADDIPPLVAVARAADELLYHLAGPPFQRWEQALKDALIHPTVQARLIETGHA